MKKVIAILLALTVLGLPAFAASKKSAGQKSGADASFVSRQVYQARENHLNDRMAQAFADLQETVGNSNVESKEVIFQKLYALMDAYHCLGLYGSWEDISSWTKTLHDPIKMGKKNTFEIVAFLEANATEDDTDSAFFLLLLETEDPEEARPLFLEWYHALLGIAPAGTVEE